MQSRRQPTQIPGVKFPMPPSYMYLYIKWGILETINNMYSLFLNLINMFITAYFLIISF